MDDLLVSTALVEAQEKKHKKAEVNEPLEYGLVIYTDGGAERVLDNGQQIFVSGSGIHGFLYANTPTKVGCGVNGYTTSDYGYIVNGQLDRGVKGQDMYADGAEQNIAIRQISPIIYFDGISSLHNATNNVAEATAFLKSLDIVERIHKQVGLKRVHYRADSKYVIQNVCDRNYYISNGYRLRSGREQANKELWIEIYARLEELSVLGITWTIEWTEGHSDYFGNIQADRLATAGLTAAKNGHYFDTLKVLPAQGRWNNGSGIDFKTNPALYFLADMKWYHNPTHEQRVRQDGLHSIYVGTHPSKEPESTGQPKPDTTLAIALVKDKPKQLDILNGFARTLDRIENGFETHGTFYGNVSNFLKPSFEEELLTFGDRFMTVNYHTKQLITFDGKEVLRRLSPAYIETKQMDKFDQFYQILERFIDGKLLKHEIVTDITDKIYLIEKDKKGNDVWKNILDNAASFNVPVKYIRHNTDYVYEEDILDVTLTYGITTPRRRVLGGVKDHNPKILILTSFEAYIGFRYYTIIQLPSGEYGIWTNWESNLRYF